MIAIAHPGTPLVALTAVVFDLETTSLDAVEARAVEIGAIRLIQGEIDKSDYFHCRINPRQPIPASATAVHGITDQMVQAAPTFAEVLANLREWIGRHVVLGFAFDFDLAVLHHETRRAGMSWSPSRTLDVRQLVALLDPPLPDHSLETLATWLKVGTEGRHTAFGDAIMTAGIFLALVPLLRPMGIRSLAEAERAIQHAHTQRWGFKVLSDHGSWGGSSEALLANVARLDSFAFRHRVYEVMRTPPVTISANATTGDALRRMISDRISSVFVIPQSSGDDWGIVTERDVLRAIDEEPSFALTRSVGSIASRPLVTVASEDYIYDAIAQMNRRKFRHLGVRDAGGRLMGALSARDLLRLRGDSIIGLGSTIEDSERMGDLANTWSRLAIVARALLADGTEARGIAAIVSKEIRSATARAGAMAEQSLVSAGRGDAPASYALLVLGSAGRGESLFAMDQDNAIVFADGKSGNAVDPWFADFGEKLNTKLDQAGVPYCGGGVMAKNASWRRSVNGWREEVGRWLSRSSSADILNADIFFDAVPVHGDIEIGERLRVDAIDAASCAPMFLKLMAVEAARVEPATGWFGRLRLNEAGRLDLKRHGVFPIVAAARARALSFGIRDRSTLARLKALRDVEEVPQDTVTSLIEAHGVLLETILRQQLRDIEHGIPPSNHIVPAELSPLEIEQLKWALKMVPLIANLLGDPMTAA